MLEPAGRFFIRGSDSSDLPVGAPGMRLRVAARREKRARTGWLQLGVFIFIFPLFACAAAPGYPQLPQAGLWGHRSIPLSGAGCVLLGCPASPPKKAFGYQQIPWQALRWALARKVFYFCKANDRFSSASCNIYFPVLIYFFFLIVFPFFLVYLLSLIVIKIGLKYTAGKNCCFSRKWKSN